MQGLKNQYGRNATAHTDDDDPMESFYLHIYWALPLGYLKFGATTLMDPTKSISKRIFKFYSLNFNLFIDVVNKCIEKYNFF